MPKNITQQFTRGPWKVQGASIIGYPESDIAVARVLSNVGQPSQANAQLIAAAPALVEALQGLFEHCAMVHKHWGDGDNTKEANAAIDAGRAALALVGVDAEVN